MSRKVRHTQPWTVGTPFLESTFQGINKRKYEPGCQCSTEQRRRARKRLRKAL